jgi:small subunit ribosomal protein S21
VELPAEVCEVVHEIHTWWGGHMPLRMRVNDEPIAVALRRFKKLLERSGIFKEMRKRKHYEKPCELRRRAELRKKAALRRAMSMKARGMSSSSR